MKAKLTAAILLVVVCGFISIGKDGNALAQQEEGVSRLEALFNLDSYQGLEEMPYFGEAPAENETTLIAPVVDVPWSKIVFESYRNLSDWNIYIADGNGSNQIQLTWETSTDIHPQLNRGCSKIVFASNRTGSYEIFTMNPDGSDLARLTSNNKDDVYPAWSPDGNKIAYQSYRNGNPEIFVMNADGSDQTRLTYSEGFDGMPAWSPDGSRIAFASDRSGNGGIWVMNPDGSGLQQLAEYLYSSFPSWSPDGSRIAFSNDASQNYFLELWVMEADGSNQVEIYDPPYPYGVSDQDWSPDAKYIAFTNIKYIWYKGSWYWTTAYLESVDMINGTISNIISNDTEWNPDWQTLDVLAPTSSMQGLPLIFPTPIVVSWLGYDNGPAGLKNFDIQVRDGYAGNWVDWKKEMINNSSSYQGIGGHTYYFRARARDNHYNTEPWPADSDTYTTIESQPPTSSVAALPVYLRNGATIHWSGTDPGGSDIRSYDLQYRDLTDGLWMEWLSGVPYEQKVFKGLTEHTYEFRARAMDMAWNLGVWSSASDPTTLCNFALIGAVRDITDLPVAGANITVNPGDSIQTGSDGKYANCVFTSSPTYIATWDKNSYGDLPATNYSSSQDPSGEVILPAGNNIIANWGFENGALEPNWVTGGDISPVVTETARHTGSYGGMIGSNIEYGAPLNLSHSVNNSMNAQEAFLSDGTALVVWYGNVFTPTGYVSYGIFFTEQDKHGTWSYPLTIWSKTYSFYGFTPHLLVDSQDTLYVFWPDQVNHTARILFVRRYSDGTWSAIQPLTGFQTAEQGIPIIDAVFSTDGYLHLAWSVSALYTMEVHYAYCDPAGQWCKQQKISNGSFNFENRGLSHYIAIDQNNEISLIWYSPNGILYARRAVNGAWTDPLQISNQNGEVGEQLEIGPDGTVYVLWGTEGGSIMYFAQRNPDGTWSGSQAIPGVEGYSSVLLKNLLVNDAGLVYVFGVDYDPPTVRYVWKTRDGPWSQPVDIDDYDGGGMVAQIDNLGRIHATWVSIKDVLHAQQEDDGTWSPARLVIRFPDFVDSPIFNIDPGGKINVIWSGGYDRSILHYLGPEFAQEDYKSSLSQSSTIPLTMTAPTLSFLYQLEGGSTATGGGFRVLVNDGLTTTLLATSENTSGWTHAWYDLTPWLGQMVTLSFNIYGTAGYPYAWVNLDEVTVGSAHPDVYVSTSGSRAAQPGDTVTFQLIYANRSPVAQAINATITATLPTGLIFQSASVTPTVDGSVLTWSVGDLPAGGEPFTILVTATVAEDAALGSTLNLPVEITTLTPELELVNNQDEYLLFIGSMVYLPITVR